MHQEIWLNIKIRKKLVGYEGAAGNPGTGPDFMRDFQRMHMDNITNIKQILTQDQVIDLLVE
jgi:hypothetical protein